MVSQQLYKAYMLEVYVSENHLHLTEEKLNQKEETILGSKH